MAPTFFLIRNIMFEVYLLKEFIPCLETGATSKSFSELQAISHQLHRRMTRDLPYKGRSIPEPLSWGGNADEAATVLVKISRQISTQTTLCQWTMTSFSCSARPQDKKECNQLNGIINGIG